MSPSDQLDLLPAPVPIYRVIHGDCREVMCTLPAHSVDSVVSDPPYGVGFMGKEWDHGVPGKEFWIEALRLLKPVAGHLGLLG